MSIWTKGVLLCVGSGKSNLSLVNLGFGTRWCGTPLRLEYDNTGASVELADLGKLKDKITY
jgi:hypothetical protein